MFRIGDTWPATFFCRTVFRAPSSTRPWLPNWSYRGTHARALTRPLAAARRRKLPAHVGEDLVQLGRLPSAVTLASESELQQGRGDGALCRDREQRSPPSNPRGTCSHTHGHLRLKGTLPSEQPEPGGSPSAKPASEFFNTHNHEAAAAGAHQLGVGLVAFASGGAINSTAGVHVSAGLGITRPRNGADDGDDGGIDSLLRALPRGQLVRNNFDAAVVGNSHVDVHVRKANVAGDPRPGFLAHPRNRPLARKGSRCEHDWQRQAKPS